MDSPGIEPGASRMQSECDTTTPQTRFNIQFSFLLYNLIPLLNSKLILQNLGKKNWVCRGLNPGSLAKAGEHAYAGVLPLHHKPILILNLVICSSLINKLTEIVNQAGCICDKNKYSIEASKF